MIENIGHGIAVAYLGLSTIFSLVQTRKILKKKRAKKEMKRANKVLSIIMVGLLIASVLL